MEVKHLIELMSELTPGMKCKYVRGEDVCTFVKVDIQAQRLYTKTPLNEEFSFAQSFISALAEGIEENVPFNTSQLLNNKGSNRAVIDSIIAHTSEFYWMRKDRSIFTVWIPSKPHKAGKLVEWDDIDSLPIKTRHRSFNPSMPLQQIFYGAPGTGKSYKTNEVAKKYSTIRTTFHPDSDYSTFVGAYKPITVSEKRYGLNGSTTIALTYPDGEHIGEAIEDKKIGYRFVKQAFMKAYVGAWKKFAEAENGDDATPQFLVIEEINRGNCAQIFGDLFQLLDRKNGFSEYPIDADEDICKSLLKEDEKDDPAFGKSGLQFTEEQKEAINAVYNDEETPFRDVAEEIAQGKVLVLPRNFYIWATMNTSDQSLFPIDSAFKRRWEWKYVRICEGKKKDGTPLDYRIKFTVPAKDEQPEIAVDVPWWDFVKAINKQIEDATKSEDKKLGYFFCKPDKKANDADECNTIISAETFVGKVVFYLWQDVFKDYGFKSDIFKRADKSKISFHDFYPDNIAADEQTNPEAIDLQLVKEFIDKVIVKNEEPRHE